jgi:hypothetical protein
MMHRCREEGARSYSNLVVLSNNHLCNLIIAPERPRDKAKEGKHNKQAVMMNVFETFFLFRA